jgi:hypothetical protein
MIPPTIASSTAEPNFAFWSRLSPSRPRNSRFIDEGNEAPLISWEAMDFVGETGPLLK